MANLTLRSLTRPGDTTKNAPLTNAEVDTNFIRLDEDIERIDASLGSKAPINNPSFTGTVSAPTPAAGDNSTKVATTAYVKGAVAETTHSATAKTTPADSDEFPIADSADNWLIKKLSFANLKTALSNIFLPKSGGSLTGALNYAPSAGLTAASTTDLSSTASNTVYIVGASVDITSFGVAPSGVTKKLYFGGSNFPRLIYDPNKIEALPGGNVQVQGGDSAEFVSLGGGRWYCLWYKRASGKSVVAPAFSEITGKPTTLAGYGITDSTRDFKVEHSAASTNGIPLVPFTDYSLYTISVFQRQLPSSPALGDTIILNNLHNTWGNGVFTLTRANAAHAINNVAEDVLFDTNSFKRAVLSYQWTNNWVMSLS